MKNLTPQTLAVALLAASAGKFALSFSPTTTTIPSSLSSSVIAGLGRRADVVVARARKSGAARGGDDSSSSSSSSSDAGGGGRKAAEVNPAKRAALEGVLQRIERNYGRGAIVKLGDADRMVVDCVGSGSMTLGEPSLSSSYTRSRYIVRCGIWPRVRPGRRMENSFYLYIRCASVLIFLFVVHTPRPACHFRASFAHIVHRRRHGRRLPEGSRDRNLRPRILR